MLLLFLAIIKFTFLELTLHIPSRCWESSHSSSQRKAHRIQQGRFSSFTGKVYKIIPYVIENDPTKSSHADQTYNFLD